MSESTSIARRDRGGRARRGRGRRLAAAVAVAALLAGCGGADDDATATSGGDAAADDGAAVEGLGGSGGSGGGFDRDVVVETEDETAADDDGDGPGATTGDELQLAAAGRERIRTAWITLEFDDPDAAIDQVAAAVEERGGFVALADLTRDDRTGELGGTVTLRVPSAELLPTLDALEDLATDAPVRRIEEEDVGAELTDIRAQLTNLTAYEQELRELLTEVRQATSDPDDLLPVVERVQSVRSDIDRLRGRQVALEDLVSLSTITVTVRPTPTEAPIVASDWTPLRTLEEAVAATGRALAAVADVAIWLVVTVVPVAAVLGAAPLAVWWWLRRRRSGAGAAPPPPVGATPR